MTNRAQLLITTVAIGIWATIVLVATGVVDIEGGRHDDAARVPHDERATLRDVYASLSESVVRVSPPAGRRQTVLGVLIARDGEVVTALSAAQPDATVRLADGEIRRGRVLARDSRSGLALLSIGAIGTASHAFAARTGALAERMELTVYAASRGSMNRIRLHRGRFPEHVGRLEADAAKGILTEGAPVVSESGYVVAIITQLRSRTSRHQQGGVASVSTAAIERLRAAARTASRRGRSRPRRG